MTVNSSSAAAESPATRVSSAPIFSNIASFAVRLCGAASLFCRRRIDPGFGFGLGLEQPVHEILAYRLLQIGENGWLADFAECLLLRWRGDMHLDSLRAHLRDRVADQALAQNDVLHRRQLRAAHQDVLLFRRQ